MKTITLPFAIKPDEPTVNGRIYPKELLDQMIQVFMSNPQQYVYLGIDPYINCDGCDRESVHDD